MKAYTALACMCMSFPTIQRIYQALFEKVAYTVYSVRPSCTFGDTLVIQPGLYADKFTDQKRKSRSAIFVRALGFERISQG